MAFASASTSSAVAAMALVAMMAMVCLPIIDFQMLFVWMECAVIINVCRCGIEKKHFISISG